MDHQEENKGLDEGRDNLLQVDNTEQEPAQLIEQESARPKEQEQVQPKEQESAQHVTQEQSFGQSDSQVESDAKVPTVGVVEEESHIPEEKPVHSTGKSEQKEEDFDFNKELPSPPAESPSTESDLNFSSTHFEDEKPRDTQEELDQKRNAPSDQIYPTLEEVVDEPVFEVKHSINQESIKPVIESSPKREEAPKPVEHEKEVLTAKPETPKREPEQVVDTLQAESKSPAVTEPLKTRSIKSNKSNGNSPSVLDLVYWRDPRKSGVVLGAILAILLSLSVFSVVSVISYSALALLTGTLSFRLYKSVLQIVQKTQDGHPFKEYLDMDVTVTNEKVHEMADLSAGKLNATLLELRRLFLVEDIVDSIKFALVLWAFTYVGAWFNGLTLVILGVIGVFAVPKVYETHQEKIDQNIDLVRGKINEVVEKVQAALPFGKKAKAQ